MPVTIADDIRDILEDMKTLQQIKFPRCIQSLESRSPMVDCPMLLRFGDRSKEASCALTHACWQLTDGTFFCCLITSKRRVAPKCKISIPRVELVGAQIAICLA